jgi:putative flippase GtrA
MNIKKTMHQFIGFGIVGVLNTFICLSIYYLFIYLNSDLYMIGYTIGMIISILNAYYWNNKFVFKKTEKGHIKPLIKTFISYIGTFLLGMLFLFIMVHLLGISKVIAPIINLMITIPLNFLLNKFWTFKEEE